MGTLAEAQKLIDVRTEAALAGERVIMGNQADSQFADANPPLPYVKQKVSFNKSRQLFLGFNNKPARHTGFILFIIFVPCGSGDGDRNALLGKVLNSFRSQAIGDVTTLQPRIVNNGEAGQWSLTGVQVPFYTDEF